MPKVKTDTVKVVMRFAGWNGDEPPLYVVSDKEHKRCSLQGVPDEVEQALGDDVTGYFEGEWYRQSWSLGRRVPNETW